MGLSHSRCASSRGVVVAPRVAAATEAEEQALRNKLKQDRREGRALLRRRVLKSDDDNDDEHYTMRADFLYQKHQERVQQHNKRIERRQKKRALDQRKKYDASGSFSVNLVTMKQSSEDDGVDHNNKKHRNTNKQLTVFRKHRSDATRSIASDIDISME